MIRVSSRRGGVAEGKLHEAEVESRWEAAPAVLVVIVLQVAIAVVSSSRPGVPVASGAGTVARGVSRTMRSCR